MVEELLNIGCLSQKRVPSFNKNSDSFRIPNLFSEEGFSEIVYFKNKYNLLIFTYAI
jgi:hypothetical protein